MIVKKLVICLLRQDLIEKHVFINVGHFTRAMNLIFFVSKIFTLEF